MRSQYRLEEPAQRAGDETWFRALPQRMIAAWNSGDGAAFAAGFSEQADFVAFEGTHLTGRAEIAAFHQQVFDGAARGSRFRWNNKCSPMTSSRCRATTSSTFATSSHR